MTETKFTPGPWEVLPLDSKYYGTKVKVGDDTISVWTPDHFLDPFASIREQKRGWSAVDDGHDHVEDGQSYANANLIAAAPDLYAATDWHWLIELENEALDDDQGGDNDFLIKLTVGQIRALMRARRKARGE